MSISGKAFSEVTEVGGKEVHHIFRPISKTAATGIDINGAWSLAEVEKYVNQYLNTGYTLRFVFYLGESPLGFNMMYIVEK